MREIVKRIDLGFNNINYKKALIYLRLNGGSDYLEQVVLKQIAPIWRGTRPDLLSIGGEQNKCEKYWKVVGRELYEWRGRWFQK